jgi:hypothetical protein
MRAKSRACLSQFQGDECEDRQRTGFEVDSELESICEEGLHHEAHLVDCGVAVGASLNVKVVCSDPLWQMSQHGLDLIWREHDSVGELDVPGQREAR